VINVLDNILADLIQSRVTVLAGLTQIGFEPPNQDWRNAFLAGVDNDWLNLYLFDLRENLKFRSNERTRTQAANGWYTETPDPPRLNCMYLMTAWNRTALQAGGPTHDEHKLLYTVAAVLLRHRSLVVDDVYQAGNPIPSGRNLGSTLQFQDQEFPLEVGVPDNVRDLGDFWSTMQGVWRPALQVTVTIPVFLALPPKESPMVTTEIVGYEIEGHPESEEVVLTIGGRVSTGKPAAAVSGAYVRLQGLNPAAVQIVDRHVSTPADGRFLFSYLQAGRYRLHAVAPGLGPAGRDVDVPSQDGEYDLQLT
jgi:hypothetical protein